MNPDSAHGELPPLNQQRLRAFIEAESQALLGAIRAYVWKAGIAEGGQVQDIALEIFSGVAVEALGHADRFDESRQVRAWLLGIAANLVKRKQHEVFRRRQREPSASELEDDGEFFDRIADCRTNPLEELVDRGQVEAILALVSEEERRVLKLVIFEGMSPAELARALHIQPGAARVRLHRALKHLREGLTQKPGHEPGGKEREGN
jgi:RNA polymerase sigma factor (sigma-70 family)